MNMPPYSYKFISMTTPCVVQIYSGHNEIAQRCFAAIKQNTLRLEKKYNFYDPDSYLNKVINRRQGNRVEVDKQSRDVLAQVWDLSEKTRGVFDVTCGTLKQCYQHKTLVEVQSGLDRLRPKTGLDSWHVNKQGQLFFKYPETIIDLGGVIKEYAVDEAARIVQDFGIQSAIINFGGDIKVVGHKPGQNDFSIAIKNPKKSTENIVVVTLNNQALATSASYERSNKIEGREFSHIIDGSPSIIGENQLQSAILSATIISDSTLVSGIYSTAFMLNSELEIPDNLHVILVDEQLRLHQNLQH